MFKKNNKKETIFNELNENPMLKQIVFFSFYLVFFVILIILLRTSYKSTTNKNITKQKTGYGYDYKLDRLLNYNYHFVYKENLNNIETIYEGDRLDNRINFVKSGTISTNYYQEQDKYYVKDNNLLTWSNIDNPLIFENFIEPTNIEKIVKKSKYISKTDYIKMDRKEFNYEITNEELNSILNKSIEKENKIEETTTTNLTNTVTVTIEKNGTLESIKYDLTNYYKSTNQEVINYSLILNFSQYDQIKEITNPIN